MIKNLIKVVFFLTLVFPVFAQWEDKHLRLEDSVWASTELSEEWRTGVVHYLASNLFDRNSSTCWIESADGDGIGQSVTFIYDKIADSISFINGFAHKKSYFENNNRIKKLKIIMKVGFTGPGLVSDTDYYQYFFIENKNPVVITLEDNSYEQEFSFPYSYEEQEAFMFKSFKAFINSDFFFIKNARAEYNLGKTPSEKELKDAYELYIIEYGMYCIKVEIEDVYKGLKYSDTCLSEISIFP